VRFILLYKKAGMLALYSVNTGLSLVKEIKDPVSITGLCK